MGLLTARYPKSPNIEEQLYSGGFLSWADQQLCAQFQAAQTWTKRLSLAHKLTDARLKVFAQRILYTKAPNILPSDFLDDLQNWKRDRLLTLNHPTPFRTLHKAIQDLEALYPEARDEENMPQIFTDEQKKLISKLDDIRQYYIMMAGGHQ